MSSPRMHCPVCNSSDSSKLAGFVRVPLVKCQNCQVVYVPLIPTIEELNAEYDKYCRTPVFSPVSEARREELLDAFEPYRKTNKILDIGCGSGAILDQAKKRGWETYGTEFSDDAVSLCQERGHQMHQGVLNPSNYHVEDFDIIVSTEVVEHIANHQEEIPNMAKLLRRGGFLYLTTPNWNAISRVLLGEDWTVIHYPEHLVYFTPKTLREMFEREGFKEVWSNTSGVGLGRLKQAFLGGGSEGTRDVALDEKVRESMETNRLMGGVKTIINGALDVTGRGDALKAGFTR